MEHPLTEKSTLYSFHGYTTRTGRSFPYYRTPYSRQSAVGDSGFLTVPSDFKGYQPTFEVEINDHINAIGVKMDISEKWNADASVTYGSNDVFYAVNNSVNLDYLKDNKTSPTAFQPGGYRLTNVVGNYDVSGILSEKISVATGVEYKVEKYGAFEGDAISYYKGGSDSFPGIKPEEAGTWTRSNIAAYGQVDYDITSDLLFGAAGRYENFTDAGDNFSWKINGRYKLGEKGAIRGSYSTGFRAPSLHQQHITLSQYTIIQGSEPLLQGTLANNNPAVQGLGVKKLFNETSENISAGLTYKFNRNFSASVDFYQIKVYDRVLFSSQVRYKNGTPATATSAAVITNPVEQILSDNRVTVLQFFINAGDTKTSGADIVLNYKNIAIGDNGKFNTSFAANFNRTDVVAITTPKVLADAGYNIFDRQERGLITKSRPRSKMILGLNYVNDKWDVSLNNSRFGEVTVVSPSAGTVDGVETARGIDQVLSATIATDIAVSFKLTDKISLNGNINNIFDVYPDITLESTKSSQAGSRFKYSSEVQQIGQLGTTFSIGLNYQF
ncbi:TonB-dependent receptor plug domain-containing protein [Flavobacterium sp. ACAM 123]|uniref:TonB-dependent receptor plug domain-containing protein n=1 Tax=Flavobacterium sp. ACAM 123 TaxID=1189620 RepID=UPI000311ACC7|nr:TonB-dependent receptor [Flavobacterium sp. ACAM 123]